jgi:hypothetical protein
VSLRVARVLRLEDYRLILTLGRARAHCSDEQEEIRDLR